MKLLCAGKQTLICSKQLINTWREELLWSQFMQSTAHNISRSLQTNIDVVNILTAFLPVMLGLARCTSVFSSIIAQVFYKLCDVPVTNQQHQAVEETQAMTGNITHWLHHFIIDHTTDETDAVVRFIRVTWHHFQPHDSNALSHAPKVLFCY